jgi:hypothetical protein
VSLACKSGGGVTGGQDAKASEARERRRCHMSFVCR